VSFVVFELFAEICYLCVMGSIFADHVCVGMCVCRVGSNESMFHLN